MPEKNQLPEKLREIIEDFEWCEGPEKLELLLQYSDELPPLPNWIETAHNTKNQVHECMTPVFVYAEQQNGKLLFHFDIPKESPTVRGFAAILGKGLDKLSPNEILLVPNDFYLKLGLQDVLTHQRLNGLSAILAYIKRLATEAIAKE